jgi:hypothetical protein
MFYICNLKPINKNNRIECMLATWRTYGSFAVLLNQRCGLGAVQRPARGGRVVLVPALLGLLAEPALFTQFVGQRGVADGRIRALRSLPYNIFEYNR